MRVIAIRDSYFNDGNKLLDLAIHKGSIYHVSNIYHQPGKHIFQDTGSYYPNGVNYYELVEQIGYHVEDMFLELPDDIFETEMETEEVQYERK